MKQILAFLYKVALLWFGDPRARIPKLIVWAGIALIAAPWWEPIVQQWLVKILELDDSTVLTNTDRRLFWSGWLLVALGVYFYFRSKLLPFDLTKRKLRVHWWTGCINEGRDENPDYFMTVRNETGQSLPWLNVHVFPSNTYQLEPTTDVAPQLLDSQYAMYRFPVVDAEGRLSDDAKRFLQVPRDELSIRIFKQNSADGPMLVSFDLGKQLHDRLAKFQSLLAE